MLNCDELMLEGWIIANYVWVLVVLGYIAI